MSQNSVWIEDEFDGVKKRRQFKHFGPLEAIEEIDAENFNKETFVTKHLRQNRPLVIRNGLKVFDCGSAFKNWSLEYLKEKCGSNRVYVRRNTLLDEYKTGKAYMVQETEFQTYVKDLIEENRTSQNSYLAVQNLRKAFAQVCDELKMPEFVEKLHAGPFLWIARSGHYEYTHMDPDDNILTVLRGRKEVRLFGCDVYSMKPNELGSKGRTIQSQIDCDTDNPNLTKEEFEKFRNLTCFYCLLKEGDILYFPAFWWHQVKSPELTISVNAFFGDTGENNFITKILDSPQRNALLYWIYNIIKQNASYPSFARVLSHLGPSLKNFLFKQWHESLSEAQLDQIVKSILDYFNFGTLVKETEEKSSKNPPALKIRGLLMRSNGKIEEDED